MKTPVHPQIQRTLAAIVVTDAVGFSKRMSQDEDKALNMINRDIQVISELCEFFEGKILKTVGDGVLMYFISAVQAAACAVEMQKTFIGLAHSDQAEEHFKHRVGVHLGDIFFNQNDMMGTGVNIAARLESEAKAGAICMSQVVYDVVKSRLDLDADYIGELSLKNISEAVAAYNVWPKGMRPEDTNEDTTEAVAPLTITPINLALQKLSAHPNHRRIKKLLYGTHQASWENDATVLEGVALKVLLESLTDRNASLEECRHSLFQIVRTLNRQETYSQIAEVILECVQNVYVEMTGGTARCTETDTPPEQPPEQLVSEQPVSEQLAQAEDPSLLSNPLVALYRDVAIRLEQAADPIRVKKMLYCLCYDSWENNNSRVEQMDTTGLVEGVYAQISTVKALQARLKIVLLRLNRKAKYSPIANTIFKECRVLYPDIDSQISMPGVSKIEDTSNTENTQINVKKKPTTRWGETKQPQPPVEKPPQKASSLNSTVPSMMLRSAAFGR
ncbi:MAG: adenylate/guanylate cyclase domain-containing protein [Cyanobacteria bacterium J06621_11]